MRVEELIPLPINRALFNLSKSVPQENGCYVLTTFDNIILYIGQSKNLYIRFKQHLSNPEKINPTKEGKPIWFYYTTFDQRNLPKLERTWLNQYSNRYGRLPVLNKINSLIS